MCLTISWTALGWDAIAPNFDRPSSGVVYAAPAAVDRGEYPLQQAEYDDGSGEYALMLLNTPRGKSPILRTEDLQMAPLTDEEVAAGKKSYLSIDGSGTVLHLAEDFKIAYVHNVTETQTNPQTGQTQTVVVRRESNFWSPFAGAIAGQMVANSLFGPRYYIPPVYQPGGVMRGYGGYGNTYNSAVKSYQKRHNSKPPAVKNRQALRTTGNLKSSSRNRATTRANRSKATRATGSGFGSSNLRRSDRVRPRMGRRSSGFGSGGRSRSFSRGRRR
ncbi:hypothetical protein [Zarconia navalis]